MIPLETEPNEWGNIQINATFDTLVIVPRGESPPDNLTAFRADIIASSQRMVRQFMEAHSIAAEHVSLTKAMLGQTLSQLCRCGDYYGLCGESDRCEIDVNYSWLLIARLLLGYRRTGLFLFEQMVELLEDHLFYRDSPQILPAPEYVELISIYLSVTEEERRAGRLVELDGRVKAVVNGLINARLLGEVNKL